MGFIGVYKAVYSYVPANSGESPLAESDSSYSLEKADDGWWTVKKRVPGAASEEPQGIVPHNYIEPAAPQGRATASYAYDQQTDEESSFAEGQAFDVYATDGDWVLVGAAGSYGFVPSNYIRTDKETNKETTDKQANTQTTDKQANPQTSTLAATTASTTPPAAPAAASNTATASAPTANTSAPANLGRTPSGDIPPPRPQRPQKTGDTGDAPPRPTRPTRDMLDRDSPEAPSRSSSYRDSAKPDPNKQSTWPVTDISGRRRVPKTIVVAPTYVSSINDDGGGQTQKWDVHDIRHYSSEKKHVFLDLEHPHASLELKAASQSEADRLVAVLGQIVGAGRGGGSQEVLAAAKTSGHKQGQIVLDFKAANSRELSVAEAETVFVSNDKDADWWLVRNISGREGLVPRKFVHVDKDGAKSSISGFFKGKKQRERERGRDIERQHESARRTAGSSNRRESPSLGREKSSSRHNSALSRHSTGSGREKSRRSGAGDRPSPDQRKMRSWIDRTGAFKVDAQLLGCSDGKVHLHKANGVKIAVPVSKLSVADVEYVESVTGVNSNDDKPLVDRAASVSRRPTRTSPRRSSPPQASSTAGGASSASSERHEAWLTFFLECGIDPQNANRYARNFTRDNMDVASIGDISSSVSRTLGLKEGDISRVTKKTNERLGRVQKPEGGLYASEGGASQNNSGAEEQVWAANLAAQTTGVVPPTSVGQTPSAQPAQTVQTSSQPIQPSQTGQPTQPIQPAQTGQTGQQPLQQAAQTGQPPTGASADLLGISSPAPASQAQKTAEALVAQQQRQTQHQILKQQAESQKEQIRSLKEQQEQLKRQQTELVQLQKTGSQSQALGPFATGVAQASSFAPSAAAVLAAPPPPQPRAVQPFSTQITGLPTIQPVQPQITQSQIQPQTIQPQTTFQSQPQTIQPQTTAPFQSQTTGPFQSQTTAPFPSQTTGPFQSQATFPSQTGVQSQTTGPFQPQATFPSQTTGPFQPQATFPSQTTGPFQSQTTGPFQTGLQSQTGVQSQITGPFQQRTGPAPATSFQSQAAPFQSQITGPFQSQTTPFQSQTTGPFQSQPALATFQQQRTGPFQSQTTGPFAQPSVPTPTVPTSTFGQPAGAFGQPSIQPSIQPSVQPSIQPATSFGQPATSFGQQPFTQQRTGPFAAQPFQSQATGPFQSQATGPFQTQATGPFQSQATGPFQSQATGPFQTQATGPFQSQATGPFQPASTFPSQPASTFASQPATAPGTTTFGNQFASAQRTGPFQTPQFTPAASQPPPFGQQPPQQSTTFTQAPTMFGQPPPTAFGQQQTTFGQQQTTFGQAQPVQNQIPSQNQATGFGFGNQAQPRANLSMASASNPFGS